MKLQRIFGRIGTEVQIMRTEIFGTFGPACDSEEILKQMIEAGMTGMRLNLSHTTLEKSKSIVEKYRSAAMGMGIEPQILIDMQGPELRVGEIEPPLVLETSAYIPAPKEVLEAIEPGDEILLDDGKLLVRAIDGPTQENHFLAEVIRGGVLHSHKSIKIVGKNISLPPLTDHDIANIKVAKEYGVTALMQPFVSDGAQLRKVRSLLKEDIYECYNIVSSAPHYVEFMNKQTSKGNALRLLCEYLNIDLREVMAIGDAENDLSMLKLVSFSVAMENSEKEVKDICHYQTLSNDNDGVNLILEKVLREEL